MKSRFLLPSNLPALRRASESDGAMARPRVQDATVSAARRFELQHNASPRFARRRQQRRQGQALLLAVLIMLLAALLSAGFLAVVSGNLNQSARIADKTRAIEASRAGIAFANAQLSTSSQGDLWRPDDVSQVPIPGNTNYNFYYSQLDRVQGWANNLIRPTNTLDPNYQRDIYRFRNVTYGKFPAPEQSLGDAPKFLLKVEDLPVNPNDDYYNPALNPGHPYDSDHAGEIKITSIGLSDDDPNVFHKAIAYKVGRRKSPWAQALRSISNWKFGDNEKTTGVPYADKPVVTGTEATPLVPPPSFPAEKVIVTVDTTNKPLFSNDDVPFNVVIVKKDATSTVRGAVVTKVDGSKLTFARLDNTITADETIQKAAALGTGSTIDFLNTGQLPVPAFPTPTTPNQPNGILTNGSLWLQNQVLLSNLSKNGTRLIASGSIALDTNKTITATGDVATQGLLLPSSANTGPSQFPGTFATTGVAKTELVNDAWNRIGAQTLGLDYSPDTRNVEPFIPTKIDSAENLARYRALTRNSETDSNGYQLGVYIDNRDDVEKVGPDVMSQAKLVEMLTSPPVVLPALPTNYTRTGTAEPQGTVGKSLEEKHLRGWVGPDEFLARGALVEITNDSYPLLGITAPSLRVTLDARGDSTAILPNGDLGPVAGKAWRNADGSFQTGVYTKVLPWPSNGTIFAEGNLRIRGDVGAGTSATRSLTVVSLGNIYVEGSLSIDNTFSTGTTPATNRKKLMLLAKKNVIVNPTRAILARTDAQTVATNTAPVTVSGIPGTTVAVPLEVANAYQFNVGDYVTVAATPTTIGGIVTAKSGNTQLTITTPDTSVIAPGGAVVRSPLEKREAGTGASNRAFFSLVNTETTAPLTGAKVKVKENVINRRIVAPIVQDSTNRNRLIFDHVADKAATPIGLDIKATDFSTIFQRPTTPTFVAELTNKQRLLGTTQNINPDYDGAVATDKRLRTYNNYTAANLTTPKEFDFNGGKTLTQLATEITNGTTATTSESRTVPGVPPTFEGYRYVAVTTVPTNPVDVATLNALPSLSLAGIGLRYAPGAIFDPTATAANNRHQSFNADASGKGFIIPLATSIEYDLNGVIAAPLLPRTTTTTTPATIKHIGFAPATTTADDALTVDTNFYQLKDDVTKSTIDPRVLDVLAFPSVAATPNFGYSIVLKRTTEFSDAARSSLLPDYRVRALKLENINLNITNLRIKPVADVMNINAFVYAQEGSWFVIPGDYLRSNPPVRGINDGTGKIIGSYIDYGNATSVVQPDPGEYILNASGQKVADLNRNGVADSGELEASLRFVRYNYAPIQMFGAIVENQTAVVADVQNPTANQPPIIKGAVQDWTDKWATYNDNSATNAADAGRTKFFNFISYSYDPSIQTGSIGANELRVPVTDDLIYQQ